MFTNCQLLLKSIPQAIFMMDADGYIQYANPAATAITGYTADELLNQPFSIFYTSADDSIKCEYELAQALKKGQFAVEGWKVRKDGTHYWAALQLAPVFNEQQALAGFSCVMNDASEKMRLEQQLRQSEERYRVMVEGVQDYSIFMLDVKGHILTWNDGAINITGYRRDEIIGKHFSIFYTSDDLKNGKPETELKVAQLTGKYEEDGWRVKKNGSLFWASVVLTALFNDRNELIGYSKVTRDLSERKEADETLRQSEERYRLLVEQVNDYGIFMLDEKGRIISWNEGARNIKGYSEKEILGKYFSIFYPEEDKLSNKPELELRIARTVGKYEEEGWRLKKDGSRFWANVVITAVYNNEGMLMGYSKVTRDLTERKKAEKALRDSYDMYRRLTEELKATNAELSYANVELEQFTSIVSHDLQEPVRTIKSFLQLIDKKLDEGRTADVKTYSTKAIIAADRMRQLIQNLLQYSQLGKGSLVAETINVDNLVAEALQNLDTTVDASRANIVVQTEAETVIGDRVQLVQLIQNLLSNALKFTDVEQPQVTIRSYYEEGQVKFAVSDNGIGIEQDNLHKVFDIFRRLHTHKVYPGTGIGLAICKKIVDRHGGRIWPESEGGKGTTFYFTINEAIGRLQHHEKV